MNLRGKIRTKRSFGSMFCYCFCWWWWYMNSKLRTGLLTSTAFHTLNRPGIHYAEQFFYQQPNVLLICTVPCSEACPAFVSRSLSLLLLSSRWADEHGEPFLGTHLHMLPVYLLTLSYLSTGFKWPHKQAEQRTRPLEMILSNCTSESKQIGTSLGL